jgi:hypothetical protein
MMTTDVPLQSRKPKQIAGKMAIHWAINPGSGQRNPIEVFIGPGCGLN